ncbi:hypothetical protein N7541_001837 [Penicillium brevicompactum]|uniref:Zn(2)-C6 fungal-type domain-containing protein n=1 Tax=Penicillium brevicompactum TaxID=5074 RepID=A0A9W9RIN6_PENBR|nr:hypothetical protein N7541_001837 [Penicillium brevicompactum]
MCGKKPISDANQSQSCIQRRGFSDNGIVQTTPNSLMTSFTPKRACDQCHRLKEKCRRSDSTAPCERCHRLQQNCRTARSLGKAGRRRRATDRLSYELPTSRLRLPAQSLAAVNSARFPPAYPQLGQPFNQGLGSNPALFPEIDQWEAHFLNLMKEIAAPSPLDKYLIGPSFHESHHRSFVQNMLRPTRTLKNAAVACAAVLIGDQYDQYTSTSLEVGHQRAALAVSELRSLEISDKQDLLTALVLGVAMITFAMHVANGQPFLIAHHTLALLKPVYPSLLTMEPDVMDYLMCLVSTETFECLLTSEIPTLRVNENDRLNVIDRYLGLTSSLFAHFYDICKVNHLLRRTGGSMDVQTAQQVHKVQESLARWKASPPPQFLERFTPGEVVTMLAQAKVLHLTALLIIYRLQHPFGESDAEAILLSKAIIAEFDAVLHFTGHSIPCTSLAYLTACFEITDAEARSVALEKIHIVVTFSKQSRIRFQSMLFSLWAAKDAAQGSQVHWFSMGGIIKNIGQASVPHSCAAKKTTIVAYTQA